MKKLLLSALLLIPGIASAYEVHPQKFDYAMIVGNAPFRKFDQPRFSRGTPEQYRVALEAARELLLKEAQRQQNEAREGGVMWQILDHEPGAKDVTHKYQVIEQEQYHRGRKITPFVVRGSLNAYSPKGEWAWHAIKYARYLVYVDDDNKVVAIKRDDFNSQIDFYEWKEQVEKEKMEEAKKRAAAGIPADSAEDNSAQSAE